MTPDADIPTLLVVAVIVALLALSFPAIFLGLWLRQKAQTSRLALVGERIYAVGASMVAQVRAGLQPTVMAALADGRLSPAEWKHIRAEAVRLTKEAVGQRGLEEARRAFGIGGVAGVDSFVSGVVDRVLAVSMPPPTAANGGPAAPAPIPPGIREPPRP